MSHAGDFGQVLCSRKIFVPKLPPLLTPLFIWRGDVSPKTGSFTCYSEYARYDGVTTLLVGVVVWEDEAKIAQIQLSFRETKGGRENRIDSIRST